MIKKILVLDDSEVERKAIFTGLSSDTLQVVCVNSVESALIEYHNSPRPDLLVLDNNLGLGQISGIDVLNILDKKVPIIMHSATESLRAKALNNGATRFITKVGGLINLKNCVASVLFGQLITQSDHAVPER